MKKTLSVFVLALSTSLMAADPSLEYELGSITVEEITPQTKMLSLQDPTDPVDKIKKIIAVSKDILALGQEVYELVTKGKSVKNVGEMSPISVVPRDPQTRQPIDPYDLEGFSMPVERNYRATIKNGLGREVVKFEYSAVYAYGGSYEGRGKYLTAVMIVPKKVKVSYGWEFDATMKLLQIMNHGSKTNPVAGATLTIKYSMKSLTNVFERNDTIHFAGNGQVRNYSF